MKTSTNTLVIRVQIEVPISREAWTLSYGEESIEDIAVYVRESADEVVKRHFKALGVLA